jgi:N-methylhydantoinase B
MIASNVRIPKLVMGDVEAQIAAAEIGARRLLELIDEVGVNRVFEAQRWLEDYSERMLRHEIAELPDGEYSAEGFLDGFPDDPDPAKKDLRIVVTLRVRGDDLEIDLTGTAPQLNDRPFNMPFEGTTTVATFTVVRSVLLDTENHDFVPQNRGIARPLTLVAPPGCLANPIFPAPTLARAMGACVLSDTIVKAFAEVAPERCCAGTSPTSVFSFSGVRDGAYWVHMDISEGAYGARWRKDGLGGVDTLFTNTRCAPIEEIESEVPLRCVQWQLNDKPVGHGRFRGGKGTTREWEYLVDGYISSEADAQLRPMWGMAGGLGGHPGEMWVDAGGPGAVKLSSKLPGRPTRQGERYRLMSGNGGGVGPPTERDPELVLADWLDDFVSLEEAREVYLVARDFRG